MSCEIVAKRWLFLCKFKSCWHLLSCCENAAKLSFNTTDQCRLKKCIQIQCKHDTLRVMHACSARRSLHLRSLDGQQISQRSTWPQTELSETMRQAGCKPVGIQEGGNCLLGKLFWLLLTSNSSHIFVTPCLCHQKAHRCFSNPLLIEENLAEDACSLPATPCFTFIQFHTFTPGSCYDQSHKEITFVARAFSSVFKIKYWLLTWQTRIPSCCATC